MIDLEAIPLEELLIDFQEASEDLAMAKIAVLTNQREPNTGQTYQYRVDGNLQQIAVIKSEIIRRCEVK